MSEDRYSVDVVRRVWDDKTGELFEVGPDSDGLNLVQIAYKAEGCKVVNHMVFTPEQARFIAAAMVSCAYDLEGPPPNE